MFMYTHTRTHTHTHRGVDTNRYHQWEILQVETSASIDSPQVSTGEPRGAEWKEPFLWHQSWIKSKSGHTQAAPDGGTETRGPGRLTTWRFRLSRTVSDPHPSVSLEFSLSSHYYWTQKLQIKLAAQMLNLASRWPEGRNHRFWVSC